eukprot:TRINITY_DN6847_c0_g2_i1.p1 TRINITY_DN6847_c0_g2~~TRINITY_DN6847_c0_g2_i1.p1  ORF type:complete len:105 (+),score=23.72 TRINITY_DN6847_c0_g2_i1:240-554(+)
MEDKEKKEVKRFLLTKSYVKNHPDSILLKTTKYMKYIESHSHKELAGQTFVPIFKVKKELVTVHADRFFNCPSKAVDCQARPEIQPRNVTAAWPQGDRKRSNNY